MPPIVLKGMVFANSEHVAAAFRHFDADGDGLLNVDEYTALMQCFADASPFFAFMMEDRGGLEEAVKGWYEGACGDEGIDPEKGLTFEVVEREVDSLLDGLDEEEEEAEVEKLQAALAAFCTSATEDDDSAADVAQYMRAEMEQMLRELDDSTVESTREALAALSAAVAEDQTTAEALSAAVEAAGTVKNTQAAAPAPAVPPGARDRRRW
jgi:hypothetical protein